MRAYIQYFKLKFISGLQYRQAAWAGIVTQLFFGFVYIMVYIAFNESGSGTLPMKIGALTTYIWLNQAFFALVYQFYRDNELFEIIKSGNISYELARPKSMYFMWYFKELGQRLARVFLRFLPLIMVVVLLPYPYNLGLPTSLTSLLLSIISLSLGALLVVALTTLYPILTLMTMNEKGIVNIFMVIADILSGLVIPIPFFPKFLKIISSCLPFQYISDLPFRLYVGDISVSMGLFGIVIQLAWIIILIILGNILLNINLKRVVVQGG